MTTEIITSQPTSLTIAENNYSFDLSQQIITDKETAKLLADVLLLSAKSAKTKETYSQPLISFILYLGLSGLSACEVERIHVLSFLSELETTGNRYGVEKRYEFRVKPLTNESRAKYLSAIKLACKELKYRHCMGRDTLEGIDDITLSLDDTKAVAGRYITTKERGAIVSQLGDMGNDQWQIQAKAIIALLRLGLRRNEIASLNIESVTSDHINVIGKGRKTRRILLGNAKNAGFKADIMAWLGEAIKAGQSNGAPLFVQANNQQVAQWGERINPQTIYRLVKRLMPDASPHDFRRTLVSDLLDKGADIAQIQRITGHKTTSMVVRYDRRGDNATLEAMGLI